MGALVGRVKKLEAGAGFGAAPDACWVDEPDFSMVYLSGTGEWMPPEEYERRWPGHPPLKAYGDRRMIDPLDGDWGDAPAPRSSADH